jgi:hypothetical protein
MKLIYVRRVKTFSDVMASIQGFANFVAMVNPEKGAEFQEQIRQIKEKYVRRR